jgi:hypothetical protein
MNISFIACTLQADKDKANFNKLIEGIKKSKKVGVIFLVFDWLITFCHVN